MVKESAANSSVSVEESMSRTRCKSDGTDGEAEHRFVALPILLRGKDARDDWQRRHRRGALP